MALAFDDLIVGPSPLQTLADCAGRYTLQFGKSGNGEGVLRAGMMEEQGVALVRVLGPLIRPSNFSRGVLRVEIVNAIQCRPGARSGTDMGQEIAEHLKGRMNLPTLSFCPVVHVAVRVRFGSVPPSQLGRG